MIQLKGSIYNNQKKGFHDLPVDNWVIHDPTEIYVMALLGLLLFGESYTIALKMGA